MHVPETDPDRGLVRLYISYRMNSRATGTRHFARSNDGGESLASQGAHDELVCRGLHAGLIRLPRSVPLPASWFAHEHTSTLLFCARAHGRQG